MRKLVNWVNHSLQRKIMLSYIFMIVIPLALTSIILYQRSLHILTDQTEKYNEKMLQLINEKTDHLVTQIDRISNFVYLDDVQTLLSHIPKDQAQNASWQIDMKMKLYSWIGFLGFNGGVRGITLLDEKGAYFNSGDTKIQKDFSIQQPRWYKEALDSDGAMVLLGLKELDEYLTYPSFRDGSLRFAIARKVFNLRDSQPLGALVMGIELSDMNEIMSGLNLDNSTGLMIVDKAKELVYSRGINHPELQLNQIVSVLTSGDSFVVREAGQKYIVNLFTSADTGWTYITLTDTEVLASDAKKQSGILLLIGVFSCAMAVLVSFHFAKKIVTPLKHLMNSMQNIEKNDFHSKIEMTGHDEVGELTVSFNRMVTRIRELIHKVYRSEIQEKEANIMALQSQINPHFLYNTLGTINAMAMVAENEDISKMVITLGDMFKYSMKQNGGFATIHEEMEHLENYITIQQYRYGDRIQFLLDVPGSLKDLNIIRLVLQPLVENAVRHGLDPLPDGGIIWIQGEYADGIVQIHIRDNGCGIELSRLKSIQARLHAQSQHGAYRTGTGIGIYNVNERFKLYFGANYGIRLVSELGQGTIVSLVFPALP